MELGGRLGGEAQVRFTTDQASVLLGGLAWILVLLLLRVLGAAVARWVPIRPAVRATGAVGLAIVVAVLVLGVAVSAARGQWWIAGAALLGAPNVVTTALTHAMGVPWTVDTGGGTGLGVSPLPGSSLPAWLTGFEAPTLAALAVLLLVALVAARLTRRPAARREPGPRVPPPSGLSLGLALGSVLALVTPLLTVAAGASLDVVADVFGRSVPAVHLGLSADPVGAAWRGAAGGLLAGFATDLVRLARHAGAYSQGRGGRRRQEKGRA